MKAYFSLNPSITFLNHGSFGACPKPVFADYQAWQAKLEKDPIQFIVNTGPKHLETSKKALANYINADAESLVFMPNPTTALNTVIRDLQLKEGDEILTTNHEYGALDKTWQYYCRKWGSKYVKQTISLPIVSKEKIIEEFWSGFTPNTKIIFLSEITSPTGLIFPAYEICQRARELGIMTIIDGAHVPAHIPLDIEKMDPDVYTGACHKWMLTPKGNSFLYVSKRLKDQVDPLIISWGYEPEQELENRFTDYHQFNGTRDFSAYLTVPAALKFLDDNNWEAEKKRCRDMVKSYYPVLAKELESAPLCPLSDTFLGQLFSIPISPSDPEKLKEVLYQEYKIEVPVMTMGEHCCIRISVQAYNTEKDIETLIDAIRDIKQKTNLLS